MAREDTVDKSWKQFGGDVGKHCRDCEERHVGCHSSCEKYRQAKEEFERYKENVTKKKDEILVGYRYKVEKIKRERTKSEWKKSMR